jgi:antitoxin (DNA-binding transcriptional repressor) of toxin-antitoxin stability system
LVTDHGQPVARIIPEAISLRQHVDVLRKVGAIA